MTENFELDARPFHDALAFVFNNTTKTMPEIINRAALYVIIGGKGVLGAMQRTPKAKQEAIKALPVKVIAASVMKKARQNREKLTRGELRKRIAREYKRRLAAIGYTAYVGWNKAAIAFGGRGVGKRAAAVGWAQRGSGKLATIGDLVAEMVNTAPAADIIGREALQLALNNQAQDMIDHTREKMQLICNQVNAY